MTSERKDRELYQLYIQEKNSKWLGILLERYTLILLGVCMKYLRNQEDAKDAVQTVFESALKRIQQHQVENIGGWLYKIAVNECLMRLRKKDIFSTEVSDALPDLQDKDEANSIEIREIKLNHLEKFIDLLPTEQKECLEKFYFQKHTYEKITALTGFNLKQVKSYIQNGKRNLKLMYQKNNDGERLDKI